MLRSCLCFMELYTRYKPCLGIQIQQKLYGAGGVAFVPLVGFEIEKKVTE